MRFYCEVQPSLKDMDVPRRVMVRALSHQHAQRKCRTLLGSKAKVTSRLSLETQYPLTYNRMVTR